MWTRKSASGPDFYPWPEKYCDLVPDKDDEDEVEVDEDDQFVIQMSQWVTKLIQVHSTFDQNGKYQTNQCAGLRLNPNQATDHWCIGGHFRL